MEKQLIHITIQDFTTLSGAFYKSINLSYQLFGQKLHSAPIILINHALTGNSDVIGENGWWNQLVGQNKTINTEKYTILAFNVPGNGYDGFLIENCQDFITRDTAKIFLEGLKLLKINQLHTIIGGSIGGGIAWEMTALKPNITQNLIPIATNWQSTDWIIANCYLQERILENSSKPVEDARIHAMLCYRSAASFESKFNRTINENLQIFNIESWLAHHGLKLKERFQLSAYKMMNQLLKTINITENNTDFENIITKIKAHIHIVGIDSDLFFGVDENIKTYEIIRKFKSDVSFYEIKSIHGHDAFLIEYEQLKELLKHIF